MAEGATVATSAAGAETIGIMDGAANTLDNAGVIRNPGTAAGDYVIRTDGAAALSITNTGAIEGSVLSQSASGVTGTNASITVSNAVGSAFGLGRAVDLGDDGSFTNAGVVSAGACGSIGASTLDASFTQVSTGVMEVDFDIAGDMDFLTIGGVDLPSLAGSVDPEPQGTLPKSGDKGGNTFLRAEAAIGSYGVSVAHTGAVNYSLQESNGQTVALFYEVDFTPWAGNPVSQSKVSPATRAMITGNHTRFGLHLDELVDLRRRDLAAGRSDYPFVDNLVFFLLESPRSTI